MNDTSGFRARQSSGFKVLVQHQYPVQLVIVLGLAVLFFSACARVGVVVQGGGTKSVQGVGIGSVQEPYIFSPDATNTQPQSPRCQLNGIANHLQETSLWCWAASTQVVIDYLRLPTIGPVIKQCDLVNAVFEDDLRARESGDPSLPPISLNCCKIPEILPSETALSDTDLDKKIRNHSTDICFKTNWPNRVFDTPDYRHGYSTIYYDPDSTEPQGLGWEDLVAQICDNRPFIFVIRWGGGGGHAAVVGGYRQSADSNRWVEVFDPGYNNASYDFYVMRYELYLGVPGDFTRDRDYINILPQS
jgi:hypothetical protein